MTLSDRIFEECLRRTQLPGEVVELLKKEKNLLTAEERVALQHGLGEHYAIMRQVIAEDYAAGRRDDIHNVHTWAATIISESNERGYMTEFDEFVLGVLNDPAFDSGESDRVRTRFMFADEWPAVSRGVGVMILSAGIYLQWWYLPRAVILSTLAMLAALFGTFFYYSEEAAKPLGVLLGRGTQVLIGLFVIGLSIVHGDYGTTVTLAMGYAILFFAHGFGIPILEKLAVKWGREPSKPFRGRPGE